MGGKGTSAVSERTFVSELQAGDQVDQVFALRERMLRERRDGVPFLKMQLADKTGEIEALVWDDAVSANARVVGAEFVRVKGRVERYQRRNNLNVALLEPVAAEKVNVKSFLPETPRSRKELWRQLDELRKSVREPHLARLLAAFFEEDAFVTQFVDAPAARKFHHAYLGGLLEHTTQVARLASTVADLYPGLDRDLLMTGALLHDIGKVREFKYTTSIDYTDEGRLLGHIVIGDRMVSERIAHISPFPEELTQKVRHLLLAHHGELEYGSPVGIRIGEAFVLHFLDNMDAKLNMVRMLIEQIGESDSRWTPYDWRLGRELFLGERESGPPQL